MFHFHDTVEVGRKSPKNELSNQTYVLRMRYFNCVCLLCFHISFPLPERVICCLLLVQFMSTVSFLVLE